MTWFTMVYGVRCVCVCMIYIYSYSVHWVYRAKQTQLGGPYLVVDTDYYILLHTPVNGYDKPWEFQGPNMEGL